MSLIRAAELRTERFSVVRTWPDLAEVAVQHVPLIGPPAWAVFWRDPARGWCRISRDLTAGEWLAWPADDLRCVPQAAVASRAVLELLDSVELDGQ